MRRLQLAMVMMAVAGLTMTGNVAANQVLNDGQLSWTWAYLAFACTLTGMWVAVVSQPASPSGERMPWLPHRAYRRQLLTSVARMETVGVSTSSVYVLRSRQVYVDLALCPRPQQDIAGDTGVVSRDQAARLKRASLREFIDQGGPGHVFAVIGRPGSGKTTLLRHEAMAMCQSRSGWRKQLPVLLYLRDHTKELLSEDPADLPDIAVAASWLHKMIPAWWLARQLDRRNCVVLFDGLDEIADEDHRKRLVFWVSKQIARYPRSTFVITSRPYGYLSNPLPSAEVLQVQRFTADQISQFLHRWYHAVEHRARHDPEAGHSPESAEDIRRMSEEKAEDLLTRLRRQPALYDLAANPLLLTMIANVHYYRGALPGTRATLYAEMCDSLLHRRLEVRNLTDLTGLDGPRKAIVIEYLALHMMCAHVQSITADEARAAIEEPLKAVCEEGAVSPDLFLAEICKTGVLVERERGVYAFAHLTLQEFLAAALIREQPDRQALLIDNVDNPWWRETTLLWAADADATGLIETCLATGTIRALTLAFDCAGNNPRQIQPATRARLNQILTVEDARPEHQRLVAAVIAARTLREVIWLDDATAVCANPVTRELWDRFAQHERTHGWHPPTQTAPAGGFAVGVLADDARRFVSWLNGLFDDGTSYRLLVPAEATHTNIKLIPSTAIHTLWIKDKRELRLHQPESVAWPYAPTMAQLTRFPGAILEHGHLFIRMIQTGASLADLRRSLTYTHILLTEHPHTPLRQFLLAIDIVENLSRSSDRADYFRIHARIGALKLDRAPARDLAGAFNQEQSRERVLGLARALAQDLSRDLDLALLLALDRTFDLDHALDLALDRTLHRGIGPDRVLALDRILDRILEQEYVLDEGPALDADPDLFLDLSIGLKPDRAYARAIARAFGPSQQFRSARKLLAMTVACGVLRRGACTGSSRRSGRSFADSLTDLLCSSFPAMARSAEDPASELRDILSRLSPQCRADPHLAILIENAQRLIDPLLNRSAPLSRSVLISAATALLAGLAILRTLPGEQKPAERLARVLGTLIVLAEDQDPRPPNEILLLAPIS
ncbi:NACHT domain-containing protein [Acrocarpospora macrocephala]|nr:NACHT domain-containing protein [Acrocarpospora macrocephala]